MFCFVVLFGLYYGISLKSQCSGLKLKVVIIKEMKWPVSEMPAIIYFAFHYDLDLCTHIILLA